VINKDIYLALHPNSEVSVYHSPSASFLREQFRLPILEYEYEKELLELYVKLYYKYNKEEHPIKIVVVIS
jgi:hypothetical protein